MRSAMARIMSCMPIHGPHSNHIDILERPAQAARSSLICFWQGRVKGRECKKQNESVEQHRGCAVACWRAGPVVSRVRANKGTAPSGSRAHRPASSTRESTEQSERPRLGVAPSDPQPEGEVWTWCPRGRERVCASDAKLCTSFTTVKWRSRQNEALDIAFMTCDQASLARCNTPDHQADVVTSTHASMRE